MIMKPLHCNFCLGSRKWIRNNLFKFVQLFNPIHQNNIRETRQFVVVLTEIMILYCKKYSVQI